MREAGYRVAVLGPVFDAHLAAEDASLSLIGGWHRYGSVDLTERGLDRAIMRTTRRLGAESVSRLGLQSAAALGYGMSRTLKQARQIGADLYIGHQEVGLWVVDRLAREGRTVGVDLEDWYSADLLPEAVARRPVALLRQLEAAAVRRSGHMTTTSRAMAGALVREYGGTPAEVVYNAFPWADRQSLDGAIKDRVYPTRPSLHWVSQTVGLGRGLEVLCAALHDVPVPVDVHLRGSCNTSDEVRLRSQFPVDLGHRLFIHPLVPNGELLSRIAEHDIGLALEACEPPSRRYTVTNKILHYLLGGLAVVATDTCGQREVAGVVPTAVKLCGAGDRGALAAAINQLTSSSDVLRRAKQAALEAARTLFCWEQQAPVLLESVERVLGRQTRQGCAAF